jgi:hypothetical protein
MAAARAVVVAFAAPTAQAPAVVVAVKAVVVAKAAATVTDASIG